MIRVERPWDGGGEVGLAAELDAVEKRIRQCAAQGWGQFPAVHSQLVSRRSKRLRPALLLCASRYGPDIPPSTQLIGAAAAVEMLHQATLYHDDIVDESTTRRGVATVQREYGSTVAALAGSDLLYGTIELFADLPPRLRRAVGRTADQLSRGQLRELETLTDVGLSIHERLRIMRGKTASLFVLAARIGAVLAGADESVVRGLARFGLFYGLCFQLADDLRDLMAPASHLGRAPGADLRDGVYTLPTLFALRSPGERTDTLRDCLRRLCERPDDGSLRQAGELIVVLGGVAASMELLSEWIGRARALATLLEPLRGTDGLLHRLLDPFTAKDPQYDTRVLGAERPSSGSAGSIGLVEELRA